MLARTSLDIGAAIRHRRRALGLDQAGLAERAGVSRQWIIGLEQGRPGAELGLVLRTLRALDLDVDVAPSERPKASGLDDILAAARERA